MHSGGDEFRHFLLKPPKDGFKEFLIGMDS
jgi:hypothetical protein